MRGKNFKTPSPWPSPTLRERENNVSILNAITLERHVIYDAQLERKPNPLDRYNLLKVESNDYFYAAP